MGVAVQQQQQVNTQRNVMGHAFMFIAGFTLIFVFLGATAGLLFGSFFQTDFIGLLIGIGGALLLILGIHMSGFLKWLVFQLDNAPSIQKPLATIDRKLDEIILPERRTQSGQGQSPGYIRSSVVGMTFAAGWTPCIGPLLGAILALGLNATASGNVASTIIQTSILLFAYSMGLAIPFLIAAWILGKAAGSIKSLNKYIPIVEKVSAIFLIAMGLLLLFGSLSELNRFFSQQPEWIYGIEQSLSAVGGGGEGLLGSYLVSIPIAFAAGLLSFLSPCVLPLIPVYIGYLTGVTAASNNSIAAA